MSLLWQLIETAPKDGTRILAYKLDHGITHDYEIVRWDGEWTYAGEYSMQPTHWQPLTPPRSPSDEEQKD